MPQSKTKKDIVKTIAEESGLTQQSAKNLVQRTLNSIVQMLADHGRIELRNFGVFECRERKARVGRNPKTGEKVNTPEKKTIHFKMSKDLFKKLNDET